MKKVKDEAVEKGKDSLSYYHYHKFDKKYDELIEQARRENPLSEITEKKRGRKKKGKILALVERLANYKASVCLFIHNFMVPFDNNQAERDLRMIKVKTKVSGCFRTEEGARDYLKTCPILVRHISGDTMLTKQSKKQSQATLISSLNKSGSEQLRKFNEIPREGIAVILYITKWISVYK